MANYNFKDITGKIFGKLTVIGVAYKDPKIGYKWNCIYESYLQHVTNYGEKQTTLDRKNGLEGYNKENCRWATYSEQNRNLLSYV